MKAHERVFLFILLLGPLAIQSVVAHPHLSFSALYASEEDGFITNAEYAERSLSAEARRSAEELEKSKEANNSICTHLGGDHITPKTSELTYKIFVKVLVRDSRQVVKNKLRELKASNNGSGADISYFFVILKKINKLQLVNESQEGKVMHDAIKEIVTKTEEHDSAENASTWINKMFDRIFCMALKANSNEDVDGLVDSFTIEEEISQHFNIFKQFWLNYSPIKNTKDSAVDTTAETDRMPDETLCEVDITTSPLNITNVTYSIFAEIVIRDSKKVAQRKLDELKSLESEQYKWYIADLTKILEHIANDLYKKTEGELIYETLKRINDMDGEGDSTWLDHIIDRIVCKEKEVLMKSEIKSATEIISIEETIEGHFDIFKQLWLNCKNLYIHRGEGIYKLCRSQRKYYDD